MTAERADVPLEEPQAQLERALIDEYLGSRGVSLHTVNRLPAGEATLLMREASQYAATKLAEVEARASYIHGIHGATSHE